MSVEIRLLTITPLGILIVYRDRLWEFRVLNGRSIYGHTKSYYRLEAAEAAGRE